MILGDILVPFSWERENNKGYILRKYVSNSHRNVYTYHLL